MHILLVLSQAGQQSIHFLLKEIRRSWVQIMVPAKVPLIALFRKNGPFVKSGNSVIFKKGKFAFWNFPLWALTLVTTTINCSNKWQLKKILLLKMR